MIWKLVTRWHHGNVNLRYCSGSGVCSILENRYTNMGFVEGAMFFIFTSVEMEFSHGM